MCKSIKSVYEYSDFASKKNQLSKFKYFRFLKLTYGRPTPQQSFHQLHLKALSASKSYFQSYKYIKEDYGKGRGAL